MAMRSNAETVRRSVYSPAHFAHRVHIQISLYLKTQEEHALNCSKNPSRSTKLNGSHRVKLEYEFLQGQVTQLIQAELL